MYRGHIVATAARYLVALAAVVACFAASATVHTRPASAAGIAVDGSVVTHQGSSSTKITSTALTTTQSNDLVVAFIDSDGPNASGAQSISGVTGGGLTWTLRQRVNAQAGTAEIWQAVAPAPLSGVTVTATRSSGSWDGSIAVVAFSGADTVVSGAAGGASGATGAPSATITATRAGSWVWGIGNDWDSAVAHTPDAGQALFDQYLAPVGDTYWVQRQTNAGNASGAPVNIDDTAPNFDRWDLAVIEIVPAVVDTQPPTVPQNVAATAVNSGDVHVSWSPSSDDVAVAGYDVLRDGTKVATTTGASYDDLTVAPGTPYVYTVDAFDAAGHVSAPSGPAPVTTPAPAPPQISGVQATSITDTSAVITWTTDLPSSSQVNYGAVLPYGSSSPLNPALVTAHSQAITGLAPGTTYHYDVVSTSNASLTGTSADGTFGTLSLNITLPNLQVLIPTNLISIGTTGGQNVLRYTHISANVGTGPFEIDPDYNATTGIATFTQRIFSSPSPGVWTFAYSVPVAAPGTYVPGLNDYNFPLGSFTLNAVNPDGSLGAVLATSPKTGYCITGDVVVGGVPNTPSTTISPNNCSNPTLPLGWSVGWGDQYDQTDAGQPISLQGIPDGTYILHAVADPQHVLTESDATDNVTDTLLRITGTQVAVLGQSHPGDVPPAISLTSPAAGSDVSDTVLLQASATATAPATIASVQFLLDGQPLGAPVTSAPYKFSWTVGSTPLGAHLLSARATDSNGEFATATPVSVNVVPSTPPVDTTPPTVSITNPLPNAIVSNTVPVAANPMDNVAVASVQFLLDGQPLGSRVTSAPWAINWDTTTAAGGSHILTAVATDTSNLTGTSAPVTVTVQNPAPPMTCFVLQAQVTAHGSRSVTTPKFSTVLPGELLIAFVSADGPEGSTQTATVSGAGVTWTLVKRANAQAGDAEVWVAPASSVLTSVTVSSVLAQSGFHQDLTLIAMEGAGGVGASVAGSAATGAPSVSLTTTGSASLIFAVGHDWDRATPRALPPGWVSLEQWVDTSVGDTDWTQYTNATTGAAGSVINVADLGPATDRWDLAAVELLGDGT